jgi:hypothetical protein
MTINDSIFFIAAELHKQTKPIANFKDASDKALLGRTIKLINNQSLSLNGQATSSILTDIGALENLLKTNPTDPNEQELKKYLVTTSTISATDVLVAIQTATDAAAQAATIAAQAAAAQKAASDAAKIASTDTSNATKQKAAADAAAAAQKAANDAAKAAADAQAAQDKANKTASKKKQ